MVPRSNLLLTVVLITGLLGFLPHTAKSAPSLVFDVETGTVLHENDAGRPWYPASLTKLMTGYVVFHALKTGQVTLKSKIKVTANARAEPPSKVGLPLGAEVSVDWALQALMVRSANDMAVVLAEGIGGSEANFVRMMNDAARRLAMTGTYFSNPNGLPDRRNVTTARDMGLLARALIREFPQHQKYFDAPHVKMGKRRLRNRNATFLKLMKEGDGMKTGFICNSGFNVVASATRNKRRLVTVVLGSSSGARRAKTASALIEQGFTKRASAIAGASRKLIEIPNSGAQAGLPVDMAGKVCRRMGKVRLTLARTVRGWSVVLGNNGKATSAQATLDAHLKPLRGVFHGGRAGVVRIPDTKNYAAMIYSLSADQSEKICSHLRAVNQPCKIQQPEVYKAVLARLEQEAKERAAKKRAAAKAKKKKRKAARAKAKAKKKKKSAKKKRRKKKSRKVTAEGSTSASVARPKKKKRAAKPAKKKAPAVSKGDALR